MRKESPYLSLYTKPVPGSGWKHKPSSVLLRVTGCREVFPPRGILSDPSGIDTACLWDLLTHILDMKPSVSNYVLGADGSEQDGQTFCSCRAFLLGGWETMRKQRDSLRECSQCWETRKRLMCRGTGAQGTQKERKDESGFLNQQDDNVTQ